MVYSGSAKMVYFHDWSRSSFKSQVGSMLDHSTNFYFMSNRDTDFEKLLVHDLLALTLVYADLVSVLNEDEYRPSQTISNKYRSIGRDHWNLWVTST